MKYLQTTILILALATTILPLSLVAQSDYQLLEPSIFPDSPKTINVNDYFTAVYRVALSAAVILAVLMLVIAGIQYTAAGVSESAKTDAKKRFREALTGLLLALGSWLILNTINPQLANPSALAPTSGGGGVVSPPPAAPTPPTVDLGNERNVRLQLFGAGICIWSSAKGTACDQSVQNWCTSDTERGCTNVRGLPNNAINGLIRLKRECGCNVLITGGTERTGHATHGPGNSIVDLDFAPLADFLKRNGQVVRFSWPAGSSLPAPCTVVNYQTGHYRYEPAGAPCARNSTGAHWHVQYD